ncbi:MAG: isopentenyl-diphosphate delta-isomerase [Bacteroidetes bacterium]|nr:isopentenyl-diphosphate delta-isomerase [Bacteroidota bacterium]
MKVKWGWIFYAGLKAERKLMEARKNDHIELAFSSQIPEAGIDRRFNYEPMTGSHRQGELQPFTFLGKTLRVPMWVSSMTGGTVLARTINTNLARACNEFGMGMGLGSCRILLENDIYLPDFDMRGILGDDLPLYANIGIVQLEDMLLDGSWPRLVEMVYRLRADGLIVHVNPVQEWLQMEGDVLKNPPFETIQEFLQLSRLKVIVKEVGQGMGPGSIAKVMSLPLEAFELAGFGGTNFARVELARSTSWQRQLYDPMASLGNTAGDMLNTINGLVKSNAEISCRQIIISGGIRSFLDGYYHISRSLLPSIFGQASNFLSVARGDYEDLRMFITGQVNGLRFARAFLQVKE